MSGGFIKGNQLSFSGKYADLTGKPSSANNYRISEEHMTIGTGNQTINVANTDRIIGLTFKALEANSNYPVIETVMFGSNRDTNAVFIGRYPSTTSHYANFKFDITTTQIVISAFLQGYRSLHGASYMTGNTLELEKMIILRKEIN